MRDGSNHSYGLAYSIDASTFTLVGSSDTGFVVPGYFIFKTGNKIFLGSSDGFSYVYDGSELKKIDYPQYQRLDAIDSKGTYHKISSSYIDGSHRHQIEKYENGVISRIGSVFARDISISQILVKDNRIIVIGYNSDTGLSVAYFLDKNEWMPIPTTNHFLGAFKYNDRILAYTSDGIIAELVSD